MSEDDRTSGPRPIPVTEAVRDLIRKTATEAPSPEPINEPDQPTRTFHVDSEVWIARIAGEGGAGARALAPAPIVAVRFFRCDDPETPRRDALLPKGADERPYDDELIALFRTARSLETDEDRA